MKTVKYQGFPSQSFSITGSYPPFFCQEAWSMRRVQKLRAAISPVSTWYDTAPPGPWKFTDWFKGHLRLKIQRNFEGKLYIYIYLFCRPPSWGFTVIFPLNQFFGIKVVLNNERFEWKPHQGMEKNKKKIATSGDFTVSWVCYPVSHRKCWLWTGPRM